uniref:hypothetical protein n=1 Tax=Prevotellamassilia timonensis TaxID=1852370 RepID=UPI003FF0BFC0
MTTTRKASDDEITQAMMSGITFKGAKLKKATAEAKVKTKAKKKTYITGLHGSGSANQNAENRPRRATRHQNKCQTR